MHKMYPWLNVLKHYREKNKSEKIPEGDLKFKIRYQDFLVIQWLRLCAPNTEDTGLIPGQGTKIPHVAGVAK